MRPTHKMEAQVSVFMPPVNGWSSYTPLAPGSLFVAFYDSQGYG
jgi:hypothetical protein